MANAKNIFIDFEDLKSAINIAVRNKGSETAITKSHVDAVKELNRYFKSCCWANNENERKVYYCSVQGMPTRTAAAHIGIAESSYRSTVSRLTSRLREVLGVPDGRSIRSFVESSTAREMSKFCVFVKYLASGFDFYSSYSPDVIGKCDEFVDGYEECSEPSEQELFNAIAFLAVYSKGCMDKAVHMLNKKALVKVMEDLQSGEYTLTHSYVDVLAGMKSKSLVGVPDKYIVEIKERCVASEDE